MQQSKRPTPEMGALLREVVGKQQPSLLAAIDLVGRTPLSPEMKDGIWDALAAELCETGLNARDEPNARGRALEELISLISTS
jgi:hypothetical protein